MAISYGTYTITDEMDGSQFWTSSTAPTTPNYTFTISNLSGDDDAEIKVGDIIFQGVYRYTVTEVGTTTVKAGTRQSLQGATGTAGLNNATVTLYKRGTSSPALPNGNVTYTFSSGTASGSLNGWTQAIPTGTDPLYAIYAVASSNSASDTIGTSEWNPNPATVVMENGVNGDDGYNQATIYLYQRKSGTAPSKPSSSMTYYFATGNLTNIPSGWYRYIPSGDDPCYVTTAVAVGKDATYSITSSSWADVVKLAEDGISPDPLTVSSTKYQSGTSNTTAPTGTWSDSPVTVAEGNYLWTKVTYSDGSYSYSVAKQGKSGTNGTSVTVTSTVYAYQLSTSGTTVPTGTWQSTPQAPTTTQYAWTRTTTTFSDNSQAITYTVGGKTGEDGEDGKMLYGTCPDTAIGTAAKVVACTDATELYAGLAITIKFTNGNTASAPTLNVNGLGAKNIYFGGANASSSNLFIFAANSEIQFVYNGTAFVPIGHPCTYYGTCDIAAGTAAKTSTIAQAVVCKGTVVNLQMTNANTVANPTLNVSSTGAKAIYANGARPTADSPYNWIASSTVSFTFDGQYWRMGDTSSLNKVDAVNTLAQSAKDTADSKVTTYYSASTSTPSNPSEGDLWIKTDDENSLWRYNGSTWVSVDNTNIQTALTNAATAQSTADGKIVTYAQDGQPSSGSTGDLWIDTNDNNKLYRYNGSSWVEVAPEILVGGRNYFAICNSVEGYLNSNGQSIHANDQYKEYTSDFIPVSEGEKWVLSSRVASSTDQPWIAYAFYTDKDMSTVIGSRTAKTGTTGQSPLTYEITVPSGANYIRASHRNHNYTALVKLEKGNILTDWTPAPEDQENRTGGRNYILDSNIEWSTLSGYKRLYISEAILANTTFTLSLRIDADDIVWASSGNMRIGMEIANPKATSGTQYMGVWVKKSGTSATTGIAGEIDGTSFHDRVSYTWVNETEIAAGKNIDIYIQGITSGTVIASKPKMEIGNTASDWSPAPEDLETSITAAQNTATTALESANGKNQVFYQEEAPTGGTYKSGDTWFKMGTTLEDATKTGDIVTFDGSGSVKSIVVNIDPIQSGSGDPSPSNIRPIIGYTGANVLRTGRNFISTPTSGLTQNGITYTPMEDGSVHVEGTSTGTSYFNYVGWGAKLAPVMEKAGVELAMSGGTSDVLFYTQYRRTGSTSNVNLGVDNGSGASFTVPDDLDYYAIYLRVNSGKTIDTIVYPMLRLASDTDTTYEPYTGTTYPVSFGSAGTVYGGTLDVVSGVLTVDRANVDLGTLSWDTTTVYGVQVFRSSGINATVANQAEPLFDCYKSETTLSSLTQNNGSAMAKSTYWSSTNTRMVIHDERYTTAADLKTALSGHFVCYKLATPQTYQLTPAQIALLTGTNVMWADTGNITVTGVIEESEAAVEVYQWDETNNQWELTPYGSEVFASIDAGKITTGQLSTILIKSNNDDYWNLSGVDIVKDGKTYKANTLQTNHLIAEDDVYVYGGEGSRLYIPTDKDGASTPSAPTDDAYIDINNKGMEIASKAEKEGENSSTYTSELKTTYPSDGKTTVRCINPSTGEWRNLTYMDGVAHITTETWTTVETGVSIQAKCKVYNASSVEQDPEAHTFSNATCTTEYVYNTIHTGTGIRFEVNEMRHYVAEETITESSPIQGYKYVLDRYIPTYRVSDVNYYNFRLSQTSGNPLYYYDDSDGRIQQYAKINLLEKEIDFNGDESWVFSLNGKSISKLAAYYPTQSDMRGASAVYHGSGLAQYVGLGVNTTSKQLFVYASNNPASLSYIGKVQLS